MSIQLPEIITPRQHMALDLSMGMVADREEQPMTDNRRAEITTDISKHVDQLLTEVADGKHRAMVIITLMDDNIMGLRKLGYRHDLQKLSVCMLKEAAAMAEDLLGPEILDALAALDEFN